MPNNGRKRRAAKRGLEKYIAELLELKKSQAITACAALPAPPMAAPPTMEGAFDFVLGLTIEDSPGISGFKGWFQPYSTTETEYEVNLRQSLRRIRERKNLVCVKARVVRDDFSKIVYFVGAADHIAERILAWCEWFSADPSGSTELTHLNTLFEFEGIPRWVPAYIRTAAWFAPEGDLFWTMREVIAQTLLDALADTEKPVDQTPPTPFPR